MDPIRLGARGSVSLPSPSPSPSSPSMQSSAVIEKRASISFSNSMVFCNACVSTATSSAPRDWSRISSKWARVMEQYSRVITSAACHDGGKSAQKRSSYCLRSCRCHAYRSSVFSSEPASPYGWKACLYGANCQLENQARVSLRTSVPSASTTAQAPERVSSWECCGVPSCELSRLKSSKTCARSESLISPICAVSSSILAIPA
mmetsp:Transcript_30917/g.66390  ORF Transcript_30917/g.66390 Transcript_30917/m.66390 type:complete len:204 (+) Transcript_30917:1503-2114(+)